MNDFLKYILASDKSKLDKKNYWLTKNGQSILKIQIPKILFLSFFCYILWKIQIKIKQIDNARGNILYKAKSYRIEKIEQENQDFYKKLDLDKQLLSLEDETLTEEKKIADLQLRYDEDTFKSSKVVVNEPAEKVLNELEEFIVSLREEKTKYEKKIN